jgi:hypothetical protein
MQPKRIAILRLAVMLISFGCNLVSNNPTASIGHAPSADNLNWVRDNDNAEGAFSMDIPFGWQINGGMYRFGYFDVRWMMDVRSLNGNVILRIDAIHGTDGLWMVDPIISIIAKPHDLAQAQRLIDSWRETPEWKLHKAEMTQMILSPMQSEFKGFIRQMLVYHRQRESAIHQQVSQFESRQNALAAPVSSFGYTLIGLTKVYDPSMGSQFQMFSGPRSNYYVIGNGDKANSSVNPGNGFDQVFDGGP